MTGTLAATSLDLARWQFGLTTLLHFAVVGVSIGLVTFVALMQTRWLRTGDVRWLRLTKYYGRAMVVVFAVGVVTGIIQTFQFGMNWAGFSRYVGDVFGAPLALEGLAAFFVESVFLGLWIFGAGRLRPRVHLACIWIVALAAMLSAYAILVANTWMQHPVGYEIVDGRAQLTDVLAVLVNWNIALTTAHVLLASLLTGAVVVLGIACVQLARGREVAAFGAVARMAVVIGLVAALGAAGAGHFQGVLALAQQPMKMAAAEALYETEAPAGLSLFAIGGLSTDPGPPVTRLRHAGRALARVDRGQARAATAGAVASALAGGATLVAVLAIGAAATADGRLSAVWLGALVLLTVGAFEAPGALPEAALRLTAVRCARDRLTDATAGPVLLAAAGEHPAARLPSGSVALTARGIVHRPGGPGAPVVLDGVDLALAPGSRVAIVGPSGTGKSTLADLLARLTDPDEGVVALGGVDLRRVPAEEIRRRIRLAGQDAHLLAGTIAANVRIGRAGASDDDVRAALDHAGLGAWIAALPRGIDTLVGEDGVAVSGGQRQRIGLARALVSGADVLVLDEPTAMLDHATARGVIDDVLAATPDRAVVVVTHDANGLDRFDRVLELRDGHLAPAAEVATTASL